MRFKSKLSDFLLDLHQSLAHQGLAKNLDISIGMPTIFANLAASISWHISSQKIAQLRLKNGIKNQRPKREEVSCGQNSDCNQPARA